VEEKQEKKVILVEVIQPNKREISEDSFEEFRILVQTLGLEIVGETTQVIRVPNYAFFLGKGKVNEIKQIVKLLNASYIFIDTKLTYLQLRNLTKEVGIPVIDRPHLILMIFDMRAKTKEGKLQVELSELKMHLPEIVHSGIYMDQQVGSEMGLKGPGEKKTELKRRYIEKRIKILEEKLREIKKQRELRRKRRKKSNIPIIALVGYTNSGKSTLLNCLLGEKDAYVEDMLFSTLDTLVREANLDEQTKVLFVDTIGFIRDLPPTLIYAFHSTLEEILDAWVIVHVVDASVPDFVDKMNSVLTTINELKASSIPRVLVFNKIDLLDKEKLTALKNRYRDAIFISALHCARTQDLKKKLKEEISRLYVMANLLIPYSEPKILSRVYNEVNVISSKEAENGVLIVAEGFKSNMEKFRKYFVNY
jgi:GTP-binding protein HflX